MRHRTLVRLSIGIAVPLALFFLLPIHADLELEKIVRPDETITAEKHWRVISAGTLLVWRGLIREGTLTPLTVFLGIGASLGPAFLVYWLFSIDATNESTRRPARE